MCSKLPFYLVEDEAIVPKNLQAVQTKGGECGDKRTNNKV